MNIFQHQVLLAHAISDDDISLFDKCLSRGANPNLGSLWEESDGSIHSYRHIMVIAGSKYKYGTEILEKLLAAGANPSEQDKNKILIESIWPLNLPFLKWCLENNTELNLPSYPEGPTPLIFLCYRWNDTRRDEYIKAAILLLKSGIDPNLLWKGTCDRKINWKGHLRQTLHSHGGKLVDQIILQIESG